MRSLLNPQVNLLVTRARSLPDPLGPFCQLTQKTITGVRGYFWRTWPKTSSPLKPGIEMNNFIRVSRLISKMPTPYRDLLPAELFAVLCSGVGVSI